MSEPTLSDIFSSLNEDVERSLAAARKSFVHPGTKGDVSENIWIELFEQYLPKRYSTAKAHVVDSTGHFSDQIDVVIFDRQYSPFILNFSGGIYIPAESVYAVFEAKQTVNAAFIEYGKAKISSVRKLHRTSLPIPHAGGTFPAKIPGPILGGYLSLDSDWTPALGPSLEKALASNDENQVIDLGCVAAHGHFSLKEDKQGYQLVEKNKPVTAFLFKLIAMLQLCGTVPMIDIEAYARWLPEEETPTPNLPRIRQL